MTDPTPTQKMLANVRALRQQNAPEDVIAAEIERWVPRITAHNRGEMPGAPPRNILQEITSRAVPAVAPDATATRPARPDFSRMNVPTMGPTSAPMPRNRPPTMGERALAPLRRLAEPSADTPGGFVNEMLNPVRQGLQAREMLGATMAQARKAGRTMGVGDMAMTAGLGAMTAASMVPGMPADDAARVAGKMIDVDGVMRPMLNSRGLPIHPDEEGVRNFWRWATEDGRAPLTDEAGNPTFLMHGTQADLEQFDKTRVRERFPFSLGFHSTDRAPEASGYADHSVNIASGWDPERPWSVPVRDGANVVPVYARGKRHMRLDSGTQSASTKIDLDRHQIIHDLMRSRDDGSPFDMVVSSRNAGDEYDGLNSVVFDPLDVKSAIGNSGEFSRLDPRLTAGIAGAVGLGGAARARDERRP